MEWIRDGVVYKGGGIILDGKRYWNPTDEQMIAAGWERYTPPPAPKRYSKLKIIRALGDNWPRYKAALETNGWWDQFDQAAWLDENDPVFSAVYATLNDAEKEMLEGCLYDE